MFREVHIATPHEVRQRSLVRDVRRKQHGAGSRCNDARTARVRTTKFEGVLNGQTTGDVHVNHYDIDVQWPRNEHEDAMPLMPSMTSRLTKRVTDASLMVATRQQDSGDDRTLASSPPNSATNAHALSPVRGTVPVIIAIASRQPFVSSIKYAQWADGSPSQGDQHSCRICAAG